MDLKELAKGARDNSERWFPQLHEGEVDLATFYTLGLVGEAGEVADQIKKWIRGVAFNRDELVAELSDVFTYLILLADELNIDLIAAYESKAAFNEQRWG